MFVSQKTIIINREGKILALHRSLTDPSRPLTWDLPGGQLEEGEALEANVQREIQEETGIKIGDFKIFDATASLNKKGEYWVQIGYLAEVDMPDIVLSYEHDSYAWLTKDEFLKLESSTKIKRFLSKIN
ncbi:MAG: NUDIX domain-containing protein [Candidatus Taylorbacteria bacterium]|nr:NUDIX domain-containing protein [Candidatus Taylorbacteria bacterium]